MRRSLAVTGIIAAGLTALAMGVTPAFAQGGQKYLAGDVLTVLFQAHVGLLQA